MSAPFRLTTLGALDLRHRTRGQVTTLLVQPKRVALLVYLLVEHSGEMCQRDALLALFWPESDDQKARASLRQALQFLRRTLGEAAVRTRGDDLVGIDPMLVSCDVRELHETLEAGAAASALRLYGGPFLTAFGIVDAPAFEQWLSATRARLHRQVVQTALGAAEQADTPQAALTIVSRAAEIAPGDERVARLLALTHERLGNRAAALGALELVRRWLRTELDVEPSAETEALEAALRARRTTSNAVDPAATPVQPVALPGAASDREHPPRAWWRAPRPATAFLLAASLSLLLLLLRAGRERGGNGSGRSDTNGSPARVVVMPFADRTGEPSLSAVGSMAADWITGGLSAVEGLTVVPLSAVRASMRALSSDTLPADSLVRRIARDVGATMLVQGVAYRTNGSVHLQAEVTDVASGTMLRPVMLLSVPADSVMQGIDRLRVQVMASLAPLGDSVSHLRRAAAPPTYDAYRAYLRGLDLFVQGDPAGALTLFERAARDDSTYAMPRIAAGIMLLNLERADEAERMLRSVQPQHASLGPLERATFDMVQGMLAGNLAAVDRAVREQARIAPGTIGEYMVAEVARRRGRPTEALRVLRSLGPDRGELRGWRPYWRELTSALHMRGDYADEAAAARAAVERYGAEPAFHGYLVRALAALGDTLGVERAVAQRNASVSIAQPDAAALWYIAANVLATHEERAMRRVATRFRERELAWYAARTGAARSEMLRWRHARALALTGNPAAARDTLQALMPVRSAATTALPSASLVGLHGAVAAMLGDQQRVAEADAALIGIERSRSLAANVVAEGDVDYWRAVLHAQRRDAVEATTALRKAFNGWRGHDVAVGSDPWFAPIRSTPEFAALRRVE